MIAVGVGFGSGCAVNDLIALATDVLRQIDAYHVRPCYLATLDRKRGDGVLETVAGYLNLEPLYLPAVKLATVIGTQQSSRVARAVEVGSVAEAAALAALGPGARLVVRKRIGHRATGAVATLNTSIDSEDG